MTASLDAILCERSSRSMRTYMENVTIDCVPQPKTFGRVADGWQWESANRYIPAMEWMMGIREEYQGPLGFYQQMHRGSNKTTSIAMVLNCALAFSRRKITAIAAAKDRDQAELIRRAMTRLADLNPWFGSKLKIDRRHAEGPSGELDILAADEKGTFGYWPDLIVCDEFTHWTNQGMWTALLSTKVKRPRCIYYVITNAGYISTWQYKVYKEIAEDKEGWDIFKTKGVQASWISKESLASTRKLMPAKDAMRLFDNIWVEGSDDAVFRAEDIEAAFTDKAKSPMPVYIV